MDKTDLFVVGRGEEVLYVNPDYSLVRIFVEESHVRGCWIANFDTAIRYIASQAYNRGKDETDDRYDEGFNAGYDEGFMEGEETNAGI